MDTGPEYISDTGTHAPYDQRFWITQEKLYGKEVFYII